MRSLALLPNAQIGFKAFHVKLELDPAITALFKLVLDLGRPNRLSFLGFSKDGLSNPKKRFWD